MCLFNFGGGKYKTTNQHPLLDPPIQFRDCAVHHNQSKLAKHLKIFFLNYLYPSTSLQYLNYSVVNFQVKFQILKLIMLWWGKSRGRSERLESYLSLCTQWIEIQAQRLFSPVWIRIQQQHICECTLNFAVKQQRPNPVTLPPLWILKNKGILVIWRSLKGLQANTAMYSLSVEKQSGGQPIS